MKKESKQKDISINTEKKWWLISRPLSSEKTVKAKNIRSLNS